MDISILKFDDDLVTLIWLDLIIKTFGCTIMMIFCAAFLLVCQPLFCLVSSRFGRFLLLLCVPQRSAISH